MRFHYKVRDGSWGSMIQPNADVAIDHITRNVEGVTLIQFRNKTLWEKDNAQSPRRGEPSSSESGKVRVL